MSNNYAGQQMSEGEWLLNNACNKYALMCIPHDYKAAYDLSELWFDICREDKTKSPRQLAVKKCPNLFSSEYQQRLQRFQNRRGT